MSKRLAVIGFVFQLFFSSLGYGFTIGPTGNIGGTIQNAVIQNNHLFVGEWRNLRAYDLSQADTAPRVGSIELSSRESALAIYNSFALLSTGNWLTLIDLTNPEQMVQTSRTQVPPAAYGRILADGHFAFLLTENRQSMSMVDLMQPTNPAVVATYAYSNVVDVAVAGGKIYLLYTNLLKILDYSQATNPVELASSPLSFEARNIVVQGQRAYLGTKTGLRIVDVGNPAAIAEMGVFNTKKWIMQSIVQGEYVYLAVGEYSLSQFVVANVSNPAAPVGKYTNDISGSLNAFCVGGPFAAISADDNAMVTYDIGNPDQIRRKLVMPFIGDANRAWICARAIIVPALNGALVYDLANPTNPVFASQVDLGFGLSKLTSSGDRLYGWRSYSTFENSQLVDKSIITVADFANLQAVTQLGTFALSRRISLMAAQGSRLFVAGTNNPLSGFVEIHDVANPAAAVRLNEIQLAGTPMSLFVDSHWLVVGVNNRVEVYDITNPAAPRKAGTADVSGAIASCVWAGGGQLLAGSIPLTMPLATNWWLDVFSLAADGTLTRTQSTQGRGAIWSVQKIEDVIFTGIMGGSTECYVINATGIQLLATCHSPSTVGLTVVPPGSTGLGYVYSIEGYRYYMGSWYGYADYGIYIQSYDPKGQPPIKGVLVTKVEPAEAAEDGCTAEPARLENLTLGTTVPVVATPADAWNFVEWTGAATGGAAKTDAAITQEQNEAVAHFVKPVLTLAGDGKSKAFSPVDTNLTQHVAIMELTLSVSIEAGWTVTAIDFLASGLNGNELVDLEHVQLWKGEQFLGQTTYVEDNGRVTLPVNTFIAAGSSIHLQLLYKFDTNKTGLPPLPKEYRVETSVARVQAVPTQPAYPNFEKVPPNPIHGGPLFIAPIWNDTTQEGFSTIQAAVDDPDTQDDDLIFVSPGTYTENVRVHKGVTVRSFSGPERTVVQAKSAFQNVFQLTADFAAVEGFTIQGASSMGMAGIQIGEGVSSSAVGRLSPATPSVMDINVASNRVVMNYLGIRLMRTVDCYVEHNLIISNNSSGITVVGGTSSEICHNVISGNDGYGIGLFLETDRSYIYDNLIGVSPDGTQAWPNNGNGIYADATSGRNTIGGNVDMDGNVISGNRANGMWLESDANVIQGNIVGLNARTTAALPNLASGIVILGASNALGGDIDVFGNIISGNREHGIALLSPARATRIEGNMVGTDVLGERVLGNENHGILLSNATQNIIGGRASLRNLISGNGTDGIHLVGPETKHNWILGNFIGCSILGTNELPNQDHGVCLVNASENVMGGEYANVISGNGLHGIRLESGSARNEILGNLIGTDVSGKRNLANRVGIYLDNAPSNHIGPFLSDADMAEPNVISGNFTGVVIAGPRSELNIMEGNYVGTDFQGKKALANSSGIEITRGARSNYIGSAIHSANLISGNSVVGVIISGAASDNVVAKNYIGTDVTGEAPLGNGDGIQMSGSTRNQVGGSAAAYRNVISGNQGSGVVIDQIMGSSSYNDISGNFIGLSPEGSPLPNQYDGIRIRSSPSNSVGGVVGNVISGNGALGISIEGGESVGNNIKRNLIGLDKYGAAAVPNGEGGIKLYHNVQDTHIGGVLTGEGNTVSGNTGVGIEMLGGTNWVMGNDVGTDITGLKAVPNSNHGIVLNGNGNVIGSPQGCNVISGNGSAGILISVFSSKNRIQANFIGLGKDGETPLGNLDEGINIFSGSDNLIGGDSASLGNAIAFNKKGGVVVGNDCTGNSILANNILAHGPGSAILGIDLLTRGETSLLNRGVTLNDFGDPDRGANNLQNYPVIDQAMAQEDTGTVMIGSLDTTANASFLLQFFANYRMHDSGFGEGEFFLGQKWVRTDSLGHVFFKFGHLTAVPVGYYITATATDSQGNTSEFSRVRQVEAAQDSDLDGVPDLLELAGPNQGDANRDGIPDSQQSYVATTLTDNDRFVSLVSPVGTVLTDVRSAPNPSPTNSPPRATFPLGFFEFNVKDLGPTKNTQVDLLLPPGIAVNRYYKFGPTSDNPTPHWYSFLLDGTTGAQFLDNTVRLHFRDGWRGDDDLIENDDVNDIGGPAFERPLRLYDIARLTDGAIQFLVECAPNEECQIETSGDLLNWQVIFRTNSPGTPFEFRDSAAASQNREFYRASQSLLGSP